MKVELRTIMVFDPESDQYIERIKGMILVSENNEESNIIDMVMGNKVGNNGLISKGLVENRLSDGYGEHYLYIPRVERLEDNDIPIF